MKVASDRIAPVRGDAFELRQSFDVESFASRHGGVTVSTLKTGSILYAQGDPADSLFYLKDGQVQIAVVSNEGKQGILGVLGRGDFCGEGSLLGNRARVSTATCIADSFVARLERSNVVRAICSDPAVAERLMVFALTSVVRLREALISQLFEGCEKRLARVLLVLAHQAKGSHQDSVIRNVDQEALAQMVGTTRSRVNYFMNKFRRLGCIDYNGSGIVLAPSLLEAVLRENSFDRFELPS